MSNKLGTNLSHQEITELIPSYIHGKLSSDLQREVQEHIAHCESCFQAQQESDLVRRLITPLASDLHPLLSEQRISANIERTLANIEQAELDLPKVRYGLWLRGLSSAWQSAKRWLLALRATDAPVQLTLLAQASLLCVAVGLLVWPSTLPQQQPSLYQTQSQSTLMPSPTASKKVLGEYLFYRVVFKPAAVEKAIRQLLIDVGAQLYDGPSAMGVYTIIVPVENNPNKDTLELLRTNPSVMLAERAIYRDK